MPVLRVQAPGRTMSDFSYSVRCPYCGGRFAPNDGSCCEPPDEEEGEDLDAEQKSACNIWGYET